MVGGVVLGLFSAGVAVQLSQFKVLKFAEPIGCGYKVGGECQTMFQSEAEAQGLAFASAQSCGDFDFCKPQLLAMTNSTPETDAGCIAKLGDGASACGDGCCPADYECDSCLFGKYTFCVAKEGKDEDTCVSGQLRCGGNGPADCNPIRCCDNPPYDRCTTVEIDDIFNVAVPICDTGSTECPPESPIRCPGTDDNGNSYSFCCGAKETCLTKKNPDGEDKVVNCTADLTQACNGLGEKLCQGTAIDKYTGRPYIRCCSNGTECQLVKGPTGTGPTCINTKCPLSTPQKCAGLSAPPESKTVCCGAQQSCFELGQNITSKCSDCDPQNGGQIFPSTNKSGSPSNSYCCAGGSTCGSQFGECILNTNTSSRRNESLSDLQQTYSDLYGVDWGE